MATNDSQGTGIGVNNPDLTSDLTIRTRSVRNGEEAWKLVKFLVDNNRDRNKKNARIMAKYNSEKPHAQSKLESEGLGWKSNFSTKPLTILIEKVAPRFRTALDSVRYLTNSKLPEDVEGAADKTSAFRREVTQLCRARRGWKNFIDSISMEDTLFGYTGVLWLDEFMWFPQFFRQDQLFVPDGTKQESKHAQLLVAKEDFLIHELFSRIQDKESAREAGWDLTNTVEAINNAMPMDRRSTDVDWERMYQDLIRESSIGASYEKGAKVVSVFHLLAVELTGKVSHFIVEDKSGKVLFERMDRFDSMVDTAAFFSFQYGNGTLHGSKGIGREIYAMAGILDRARNDVVDRLLLAGKVIIQGDERLLKRFRMSLVGNAILIGSAYTVVQNRIDGDVEPFFALDNYMTSLLDQIAGAASPKQLDGERVTAAQVNLVASREEESRDVKIERFMTQFADMMQTMQKRMIDPDTDEADAKAMQKRLLDVMTREELKQLAESPVAGTVEDYTEFERQQIVLVATESRGNPLYNQKELERQKLIAQIDEEFADKVLLPDNDPTETSEQQRLQQIELQILTTGQPVPVSPRDNHRIHLDVLKGPMEQAAQEVMQNPQTQPLLQNLLDHASQHVAIALESGVSKAAFKEDIAFLDNAQAAMQKLAEADAEKAALEEQAAQLAGAPPEAPAPPPIA